MISSKLTPTVRLSCKATVGHGFTTDNCLVIAARDADSDSVNDPGGATCWWYTSDRDLLAAGVALTSSAAAVSILLAGPACYVALAAAFGALTVLHGRAPRWSGDAVRALADFALLSPIPVLAVMVF